MDELNKQTEQEEISVNEVEEKTSSIDDKNELSQKILDLIKKDDVDLFAKELEACPELLGYKLGILPLTSVCALFGAEKLLAKLTPAFVGTNSFIDLDAPIEVTERLCECLSGYEELFQNTRFIEPSEILLLKKEEKAFKSFLKKGGIKTISSRKRIEVLLDKLYTGFAIKANGERYSVIPPKTPQRKAFYTASILAIILIVVLSIVLPLTLRVNVVYYSLGEEYGKENGLTGKKITIESPERDGYTFLGWFKDEECTEGVGGKLKVGVEKLYAGWKLIEYKVELRSDYDDFDGEKQKIISYSILSEEELPILSREGYLFIGWYNDEGKRVTSIETKEDIVLNAKYKELSENGSYRISDGEDFLYLSQLKNTNVELDSDIVLDSDFLSMGYLDDLAVEDYGGLSVLFNGNGHKITYGDSVLPLFLVIGEKGVVSNLSIECSTSPDEGLGLSVFGFVASINKGSVENVTVTFTESEQLIQNTSGSMMGIGGVVGNNLGVVKDCKAYGSIQVMASGSLVAGGIVGVNGNELSTDNMIENCTNELMIKSSVSFGGVCGLSFGVIKDSRNNGELLVSRGGTSKNTCFLGGIAADSRGEITNCINNGEIKGEANQIGLCLGGIVGLSTGKVIGCTNLKDVTISRCDYIFYLGGIAGNIYSEASEAQIKLSRNEGKLDSNGSSAGWVGGIAGSANGTLGDDNEIYAVVEKCVNTGEIVDGWSTGGLIGSAYLGKISYSRNEGKVNAECVKYDSVCFAGGLVADTEKCEISYCINIGDISCSLKRNENVSLTKYSYAGGLVADLLNTKVVNCINSGSISFSSDSSEELTRGGEFFAMADSINNSANIESVLGLSSYGLSWYAYSSEVDVNNDYVAVDENKELILSKSNEGELYDNIADLYNAVIGIESFIGGEDYPLFDWEE